MLDKNTIIKVQNRSGGSLGYKIPDLHIQRHFEQNEIKELTYEELIKLSYIPGGLTIIRDCMLINNPEVVEELLGEVEPEYYYTEEDVKNLLLNGSLDQLKDCLDFADAGVIELVKSLAVKMEINDLAKREAIFKSTGFNVNNAIKINHLSEDPDEEPEVAPKRRTTPVKDVPTENKQPTRRTTAPRQYKVVSQS